MVVGSVIPFSGSTIPNGYLLCDGSAVSRTTYADLFAVVGTTYGAGDESTTFNLPNLSGKVPMGSSQDYALGSSGGEETHTLIVDEIASHTHEVPQHGHADNLEISTPQLSHTVTQPAYTYTYPNGTHKLSTAGGKTAAYSSRNTGTMSRSTSFAVGAHAAAVCTKTGGISDCAAFDTASVGGDVAHNNMMPFLTMNYIICAVDPQQ